MICIKAIPVHTPRSVQATQVTEKDASAYQKYTPTNFVNKIGKKANMKDGQVRKMDPAHEKT